VRIIWKKALNFTTDIFMYISDLCVLSLSHPFLFFLDLFFLFFILCFPFVFIWILLSTVHLNSFVFFLLFIYNQAIRFPIGLFYGFFCYGEISFLFYIFLKLGFLIYLGLWFSSVCDVLKFSNKYFLTFSCFFFILKVKPRAIWDNESGTLWSQKGQRICQCS